MNLNSWFAALPQRWFCSALAGFSLLLSSQVLFGQDLRLVSKVDPGQIPSGGGGGSYGPIASSNGRYVVFASTAANLCVTSNNLPIPGRIPAPLNVYMRDRLFGTNTLVSINLSGMAAGDGDSVPAAVSPDGRYVLFESSADDLVAGDTNCASDVFLRDMTAGTTILVSATADGVPGNGDSRNPAMTPDAKYVAFVSTATNLVAGDTNQLADVFVRDVQAGTTSLASVGALSTVLTARSDAPVITDDGRYVAFFSTATNLVSGVPAGGDVYIRDLLAGNTILASTYARTAVPSNSVTSFNHQFSGDGRFLVYEAADSTATFGTVLRYNLQTGLTDILGTDATVTRGPVEEVHSLDLSDDGQSIAYIANYSTTDGNTTCLKLWDAHSGQSTIVSTNLDATVPSWTSCDFPSIDSTGRYLAFLSSATNMVTNATHGEFHLYVQDTQTGTRKLVDAGSGGVGANVSAATAPRLGPDGSFVAFECPDSTLVPNDLNKASDVFFRDVVTDVVDLISARDPALAVATPVGVSSLGPNSIGADGRYAVFASDADNIVAGDTNGFSDVFVRDLVAGTTRLVSVGSNGVSPSAFSGEPSISADGRFVAFTSVADNLVSGDTNQLRDVFIRDLQAGATALVSINVNGLSSRWGPSYSPVLSSDARFVLFRSTASDLVPGDHRYENVFLRDLSAQDTYILSHQTNYAVPWPPLPPAAPPVAAMTPNGRLVVVAETPGATPGQFCLWDSLAGAWIYTNVSPGTIIQVAISPDGNRLAYWTGATQPQLYVLDRRFGTNWALTQGIVRTPSAVLRFSPDSGVLAYNCASASGPNQVYCYDFQARTTQLVSTAYGTDQPANGASDSPAASTDGRFIAYRSEANNIVPGDTNDQPDIFLFDRQTGRNTLLSEGQLGSRFPNNRSLAPVFSQDGSTLVFESWASDLTAGDFNQGSDVFAYTVFRAELLPVHNLLGAGPWVSWPWSPGRSYTVEYQDFVGAPVWHEIPGSTTNIGTKAWFHDPAPAAGQRVYRVRSY